MVGIYKLMNLEDFCKLEDYESAKFFDNNRLLRCCTYVWICEESRETIHSSLVDDLCDGDPSILQDDFRSKCLKYVSVKRKRR